MSGETGARRVGFGSQVTTHSDNEACSRGAPSWNEGAASAIFQIAVRTAHRLPSGHDTVNTAALHRRPHVGRTRHARSEERHRHL